MMGDVVLAEVLKLQYLCHLFSELSTENEQRI